MAVVSAGPYASLHLAPDSTPPLSFLQARCRSCRPTNSMKALKALYKYDDDDDDYYYYCCSAGGEQQPCHTAANAGSATLSMRAGRVVS